MGNDSFKNRMVSHTVTDEMATEWCSRDEFVEQLRAEARVIENSINAVIAVDEHVMKDFVGGGIKITAIRGRDADEDIIRREVGGVLNNTIRHFDT